MTEKNQRTVLAWIDLETTGLKPVQDHRILEYAVVFTDLELKELGSCEGIIPQDVAVVRDLMDSYVTDMHKDNGLLDDLKVVEPVSLTYDDAIATAQEDILKTLKDVRNYVTDYGEEVIFVIGGNTISFDKGYIEHHMPVLFDKLHYRQLDVSNYKVGFPELFGTATSDAHRAMADIRASIEQQAKMREIVEIYKLYQRAFKGVSWLGEDGVSHE
jgi:oligoribonuclease